MSQHHDRIHNRVWERVRRAVLERDGYRCLACGKAGFLEVDHVVPLARGGAPLDLDNLQSLCRRPCHKNKSLAESGRAPGPRAQAWARLVEELTHAVT